MIARMAILTLLAFACDAAAQNLAHPRELGLPQSDFVRPDPGNYELTLDNGLVAYIGRDGHVPLVTMSAFVRAGKVHDRQQGAAEALLHVLQNAGPAGMSPHSFKEQLRRMTAEYAVTLYDDWLELSLNVPREDLDSALSLFSALLQAPDISRTALEALHAKPATVPTDLGAESGPALYAGSMSLAVELFEDIVYAKHPYGETPGEADFAKLSDDDVRDFHRTNFVPGNMTLAIAGDIDEDEMRDAVAALFGKMAGAKAPPATKLPGVGELKYERHKFPADKLQTWLVFGHDLPEVPLPDAAALEIMNYILAGGHLYTRMTVVTRYLYGYTNDASGFIEERWSGPGTYSFRSYSRPEVIEATFDNMLEEIERIRAEKVTDEELFIAKGALADGTFQVRYLDAYAATRDFAIERLRYGDHSRSASYVDRIRAVTTDDVLAAARKYLQPQRMQVVRIGN